MASWRRRIEDSHHIANTFNVPALTCNSDAVITAYADAMKWPRLPFCNSKEKPYHFCEIYWSGIFPETTPFGLCFAFGEFGEKPSECVHVNKDTPKSCDDYVLYNMDYLYAGVFDNE